MLRPELIALIQDAVDRLAVDIADMSATDTEYSEALEFAVADLQMAFGPWSMVDDDDFVPLDYDDEEALTAEFWKNYCASE